VRVRARARARVRVRVCPRLRVQPAVLQCVWGNFSD
jgi:hypothetical protein